MYQALAHGVEACYNERKILWNEVILFKRNLSIPRFEGSRTSSGIVGRLPSVAAQHWLRFHLPVTEVASTYLGVYMDIADSFRFATTPKIYRDSRTRNSCSCNCRCFTQYMYEIIYYGRSSPYHPKR